jgi:hypothetical protein
MVSVNATVGVAKNNMAVRGFDILIVMTWRKNISEVEEVWIFISTVPSSGKPALLFFLFVCCLDTWTMLI